MVTAIDKLQNVHKSSTILFNALSVTAVPTLDYLQTQLPALQAMLPTNLYNYAFGAAVIGNVLLRFKTNTALEDK